MRDLLVYVLLFLVAVPWYWQFIPWASDRLALGIPCWVFVSVLGSACVSVHTALVLRRPWPDEEGDR